jgi:hypothetical protein
VVDVEMIRQLPEWHQFSEAQKDVVKYPWDIQNKLETFQYKFEKFQNALSEWFYKQYPNGKRNKTRQARYVNYVTVAFQAAGQLIVLGIDPRLDQNSLKGRAALYDPEKLKKINVKDCSLLLLFNVIDAEQGKLDENRSYNIELVRDDETFQGTKVLDLIRSFEDIRGEEVEYSHASNLAEQGK